MAAATMRTIFIQRFLSRFRNRPRRQQFPLQRLLIQQLEDRTVPAIYTVNALTDTGTVDPGDPLKGDLRYCITQANASVGVADTINFDNATTAGQTIPLATELPITDAVTINGPTLTGPGDPSLILDGGNLVRHFNIATPAGIDTITINNLRLANGLGGGAVNTSGGAVFLSSVEDTFNFTDMVFDGNQSGGSPGGAGGAIGTAEPASVAYGIINLTRAKFLNNKSLAFNAFGGALALSENTSGTGITQGWTANVIDTTFDGNQSGRNGGAVFVRGYATNLTFTNTTFSNNQLTTEGFGGCFAILSGAGAQSSKITMNNCTFSGNANNDPTNGPPATLLSGGSGGIFGNGGSATPTYTIRNSTFTNNSATFFGALIAASSGTPVFNFESSILFGNSVTNGGTNFAGGVITAKNCIIDDKSGASSFTETGPNQYGAAANPLLGSLGTALGGLTAYHVPGSGSPARENGSNSANLLTDQRGGTRLLGSKVDVGSIESSDPTPIASATVSTVLTPSVADYTFTVSYSDDIAIQFASIKTGNVTVSGPLSFTTTPTLVSVDQPGDGTPRVATYKFTPPVNDAAGWDASDNGIYTVTMVATQVQDTDATTHFVPSGALTTFSVGIPSTFTVNALGDAGTGTGNSGDLRYVIGKANAALGAIDTIVFDSTLFASPQTIKLSGTELLITEAVNITGPGGGKVTVSGEGLSRPFSVNGTGSFAVNVSGISVTGGMAPSDGGAFLVADESLVLTNVVLSGNQANGDGGAIALTTPGGKITVIDSTVQNNTAAFAGGAFATNANGVITVTGSTVQNNSAVNGGALDLNLGQFVINNSLFANNTASNIGGAINMAQLLGTLVISNSTLSGNSSTVSGGAISTSHGGGTLEIRNSTVTANTAGAGGGAISHTGGAVQPGNVNILSSIVAGNVSTTADLDIAAVTVVFNKSIIGSTSGAGVFTNGGTNQPVGSPAGVAPLGNYGGATKTHGLVPGSLAINNGSNPDALPFDQRGTPFTRLLGADVDIGAFEGVLPVPGGSLTPIAKIVTPGPTPNTVQVTYTDETGINFTTIGIDDIEILDKNNNPLAITGATVDIMSNGSPRVATYTFTVPVNSLAGWDPSDNGNYTVNLLAGKISDTDVPTPNTNPAIALGQFTVAVPTTFLVTTDADAGAGSLRQAIDDANLNLGGDIILFDTAFFTGSMKTITLASALPFITEAVAVTGPGANLATVSGGNLFALIDVSVAAPNAVMNISGLTLANGLATNGGAVIINDEAVTLQNMVITNNKATEGGAIHIGTAVGSLTIVGSTISNNTATAGDGGAINVQANSNVTIATSTISGNSASSDGGVVYFYDGGGLNISRSTLSGNTASGTTGGGAIYFFGTVNPFGMRISNSTISGNTHTTQAGGGIRLQAFTGTLEVLNSTIVGNKATDGGGITRGSGSGGVTITSSIVAGNTTSGGTALDISFGTAVANATFSAVGSDAAGSLNNYGGVGKNNVPLGTPLNLGGLASNGGPTMTHLPGAGPLLDAGANPPLPPVPNVDQIGNARAVGQIDIGSVEIQSVAPVVSGFVVNDGAAQRSRLTKVEVTFVSPVDLAQFSVAGAVFFTRTGVATNNLEPNGTVVNNTNGLIISPTTGTGSSITLTFQNIDNIGLDFGSLSDGRWQLSIVPASYTSPNAPTDTQLRRLFGNVDNDTTVGGTDFGFYPPFGAAVANPFDFNNDGNIDAGDFGEFGNRFGFTLV